jgi:malic enzyme
VLHCRCLQFVNAVMARWPDAVLQFEDFQMAHALTLLQRYRQHHLVFNDDIQVGASRVAHRNLIVAVRRHDGCCSEAQIAWPHEAYP